ncbi:glycosyl hydrolase [Gordonia alkanivorans]|uniref:glycoside hydrolase family 26 protein n=1 Tax=Gordonia alkanivorans TaxID=84096 RepID=UPI002448C46A|nr:glycosyl hydrolase [Gordonia alkanivorans]MDH3022477.1 glycosyl hydrolase [Gordonia alkanivorans]
MSALAGFELDFVHRFSATTDSAPIAEMNLISQVSATPLLSLEPWVHHRDGRYPVSPLAQIADGKMDADLRRWGRQLSAWGEPVFLRFAQEMNGDWYPWSVGVHGNTPAEYREAFRRMRKIIEGEGASSVSFVWAPNVITEGTSDFSDSYPGTDVVDCLGLDGYNWGVSPGHRWQSADKLFSSSLDALARLSPGRPILITEVGCADGATPNLKAEWIADFFRVIESAPNVLGFVWFQMDKERDWRFNSSPASTESFRNGLAQWVSSDRPD